MNRLLRAILEPLSVLVLLAAPPAASALEATAWSHRQTVTVDGAGLLRLTLSPATLDQSRPGLEDVRLVEAAGHELPFLLHRAAPATPPALRPPQSFQVTLNEHTTEVFIETGTDAPLTGVRLQTPAFSLLKAARVEVLVADGTWKSLRAGAPLFRQPGAELLTLELGGISTSRVRITIDDTRTRPIVVTGATLLMVATIEPAPSTPLPEAVIERREEFAGKTVLTLRLGARHVPLDSIHFETNDALFTRNVTVVTREIHDEVVAERVLARGVIYRVAIDGLPPTAQLAVPLGFPAPTRELIVQIENGDSPPLTLQGVTVRQRPVWLLFSAPTPGTYTLLTGNPDAAAPRYDLSGLPAALSEARGVPARPGPLEPNPGHTRRDSLSAVPLTGAPLDVSAWSRRRDVLIERAGVQQVELGPDVFDDCNPQFADLRLVRAGVQVPYLLERPALSRSLTLKADARDDAKRPYFGVWEVRLPNGRIPLQQLTLDSPSPLFQRHIRVNQNRTGADGVTRQVLAVEAEWNRTPGASHPLTLTLDSRLIDNRLWIETDNGDNPPLIISSVEATYPVVRLLFKAEPGPMSLHYGNAAAPAPRYDIALVAKSMLVAERQVARLGPEIPVRPSRWSDVVRDRSGFLFWGALALVVIGLFVVIAKLLPKPPAGSAE